MPVLPYGLLPWTEQRFWSDDDPPEVLSLGTLEFYEAGTSTPKAVYTDPNGGGADATITLDAAGRVPSALYVAPGGYKIIVKNEAGVEQYTITSFEDVGLTFFENLGTELATGDTAASSGETIADTYAFVVVTSAGGDDPATINLPAAADYTFQLTIKNKTAVDLQINPDGSDTIEDGLASYTVPAAVSPLFPSVILVSDGSTWWILASHGIA